MDSKHNNVLSLGLVEGFGLAEIHRRLQNVYRNETIDKSTVWSGLRNLKTEKPVSIMNHVVGDHQLQLLA